jgi:membrane associated rhomboid family serine protease
MLYDRSYMRDVTPSRSFSPIAWLMGLLVGMFVLQNVAEVWFQSRAVTNAFALSGEAMRSGKLWTLATYGTLHAPGNILHLLANLLGLFFLGRAVLAMLGTRRFLWIYIGCGLAGSLLWLLVNHQRPAVLMGASASVLGLLGAFAALEPNRRIQFLLFFIIPVTVLPKYLAIVVGGIDLLGFLFAELPAGGMRSGIAHSAHLAGLLTGVAFVRWWQRAELREPASRPAIELPRWLARRRGTATPVATNYKVNVPSRENLKAEVDRILDKINSQGFGALTAEEKRTLDEARELLSRR